MSSETNRLPAAKRVVVKLGTGVLTSGIGQLDEQRMASVASQIAALRKSGVEVIVVSSGAVGLGMGRLGLKRRPSSTAKKQACAAVGQGMLIEVWQDAFRPHGINVAQVLLTHDDLRLRQRHLAVGETLEQLLEFDVVPVINENDTVSAAELEGGNHFGDNDVLSAMVASFTQATYLIILSTAPGLVDREGTGEVVPVVEKITPEIEAMAGGTMSVTAVGGMAAKVAAVKIALRGGCGVFIANGAEPDVIGRLLSGEGPGTFFVPSGLPIGARKRWIAYFQRPSGAIVVNECAVPVICDQGRSLLAIGVTGHRGSFAAGDVVDVVDPRGKTFARGVVAFSGDEVDRMAGKTTEEIQAFFPNRKRLEVVHRNDLVVL